MSKGTDRAPAPKGFRTSAGSVLAALLATLAGTAVAGSGLSVQVDQDAARLAPAGSATLVRISNDGDAALSGLRLFVGAGLTASCDQQTILGTGFAQAGELAVGDSVLCAIDWSGVAAGRAGQAGLAVSAIDADNGRAVVRHASLQPTGVFTTPDQGIVILLAGGIHNDANSDGRLDAGETIDYHYTLYNGGSLALSSLALVDLAGTVACPASTLVVGAHLVCTRNYTVSPADAVAGLVVNDVEVTGTDGAGPVQAGDLVLRQNFAGSAEIRVVKSPLLLDDADGSGFASVGDRLRYTFAVKNSYAQQLTDVELVEPDPNQIDTPITCQASTLGGQPWSGNGTGTLNATDTALCAADYTVRPADAAIGQALNLVIASGTATFAGRVSASGASAVVIPRLGPLQVSKVANQTSAPPGGALVYTVAIRNLGTLPLANVSISDPVPAGLSGFEWTCAGAACPVASGSGAINLVIPSFPAGAEAVFTIMATVSMNPPNPIINVVTVSPESGVACAPNGAPPPCRADVLVGVNLPVQAVPLGGGAWLLFLIGLFGLVTLTTLRSARAD